MTAVHHFWLSASPFLAVVVSGVYPVAANDGLAPALGISGGSLVEMPRPVEGMTSALTISAGTLQTTLVGAQDLGAIAPALSLGVGTLVVGIQTTGILPEAVTAALGISGGTLVLGLISRTYETEAIAPALGITSGTLV